MEKSNSLIIQKNEISAMYFSDKYNKMLKFSINDVTNIYRS